jgi:rhamnogalacturonyl hydrolase YesR
VLLISGLSGRGEEMDLALQTLNAYLDAGAPLTNSIALSAVPMANPDGLTLGVAPENGAGGRPDMGYPPEDHFFDDSQNPERRYLWRWIGLQAPDVVVELRSGQTASWAGSATALAPALQATALTPADGLLAALSTGTPNGLGAVPGLCLTTPPEALMTQLKRLWSLLQQTPSLSPSPARRRLDTRRARSPLEIARLLAGVYGHTLDPVVYTQGMAIDARLQLARLDPTAPNPTADITQLVEPYVSGATEPFSADAGSAALGGCIWGPELADATGDRRYADLMVQIAERYRPAPDGGAPPPSDPTFRTEDMAMNGMLLGRAFQLTGHTRYLELLTPFLLQARIQQDDGLFWHCRTAPYYWGRGNGFGAIGYCETLSYLPDDHPDRQALLDIHVRHLNALRQCQLTSGLYPQVLNIPGSYPEFTVTCMLGYVMARGLRRGWLDTSFRASVDLAWQGVAERIDDAGGIVDACTNTGVQDSLRAYLDRPAIFGRDDRSGSMALWFALELTRLQHSTGS